MTNDLDVLVQPDPI